MTGDLAEINSRLCRTAGIGGGKNALSVCIARPPSLTDLRHHSEQGAGANTLDVIATNIAYLENVRLVAREALTGSAHLLLDYGLTLELAEFFAKLNNAGIRNVATRWPSLIATPVPDTANTNFSCDTASLFHRVLLPMAGIFRN